MWWLLLLVAAAAGGGGKSAPRRVSPQQLEKDAAEATGALAIDTCATAFSWKGKPPAWIGQALDAIAVGAENIPIPGVKEGIKLAVTVVSGILAKLKVGGKRSATVNPNSEDGEGVEAFLPASWTGSRHVEVTIYVQARRLDEDDLWFLQYASDQEETCALYEGEGGQLSTVVATWRASGKLITTGEIKPVKRVQTGPGRFSDRVFANGKPDALPPLLVAYLQGGPFPLSKRWSGPYASWVRPPLDNVRVGVVREGDEYTLRVWLPARVSPLRWTIFWKVEGQA